MKDNENNQEPENGLGRDQERVIELLVNAMASILFGDAWN